MQAWARVLVVVPALAAAAAAGWVAGWEAAGAAAAAAFGVARVALELATRSATARFLAEAESPALDVAELALAARVGLDPGTVIEAKAAVKASVRRVMVARGAGLAGLCRVPVAGSRRAADVAWAREQAATVDQVAADSEPGLSATARSGHERASDAERRGAAEQVPPE